MVLEKKCGRCKKMKPKELFGTLLGKLHGQHYCKPCFREYNKKMRDRRKARLKNTSWF